MSPVWSFVVGVVALVTLAALAIVANLRGFRSVARNDSGERASRSFARLCLDAVAVGLVLVGSVAGVLAALVVGVHQVRAGHGVFGAGRDLQVVTLLACSGPVAFLTVEFVKRQSPLRRLFNRHATRLFFGADTDRLGGDIVRHIRDVDARRRRPPYREDGPGLIVPTVAISYGAGVTQLSDQIAQQLTQLLYLARYTSLPDELITKLTRPVLGVPQTADLVGDRITDLDDDEALRHLEDHITHRLEMFRIEAAVRWSFTIRALAAMTAGLVCTAGVWAAGSPWHTVVAGGFIGVIVGGPLSWIISDLTRAVRCRPSVR